MQGLKLRSDTISSLTEELLAEKGITQALFYYWDRIETIFQNPPTPDRIQVDQLSEAYWFGPTAAVHVYRADGQWLAVWCEEEPHCEYEDEKHHIQRPEFGRTLTVRHYLQTDEDGQWHIAYTRPGRLE